jgi:hypothetical protein
MKEKLIRQLNKFGTLKICKVGFVLTILIIGEDLSNWKKLNSIQEIIIKVAGAKYPIIEVLVNDENLFCMVLRPA